jgi:putative ABC transport system ATP-binding protein
MEPFIRISGLRKTYIMGRVQVHALDGVDMEIPPKSFMVVMGPSGSGKSTLLHLLGGLDRPTAGHIEVGGQSLETLDENALAVFRRRAVGFIFQSFNLIPSMTAQENVAFPMQFSRARSCAAARLERLKDVALTTAPPTAPPSPTQQRAAIARSVNDPQLILADEPTGNHTRRRSISTAQPAPERAHRCGGHPRRPHDPGRHARGPFAGWAHCEWRKLTGRAT